MILTMTKSDILEMLAIGWFIAANSARTDGAYWFCVTCGVTKLVLCVAAALREPVIDRS